MPSLPRIRFAAWSAEVAPAIGGSLASFTSADAHGGEHHWLRPADAAALAMRQPLGMASFPLVPWCNRIRDGRFVWQGRKVQLAPNRPGSPHTIHGIGWQRPWQVERVDGHSIDLVLEDEGRGDWPFPFQARQRYALDAGGLEVRLDLCNTGTTGMPAGIGHHPYFRHLRDGAGTRVTASVEAMWRGDAEVMPTQLAAGDPAVAALSRGMRLADFVLDNNFTGFGRTARIDWPDGSAVRIVASEPLDFMVLYSPASEPVFVLEAVSNCTDWVNLLHHAAAGAAPATVGGVSLEPGATLVATTRFEPQRAPGQNRK